MPPEDRYSRQSRFAGVGQAGQQRLREACIAIVGCGALGTVQADLLARAGVGKLILIDRDFVETGNLQRQVLFEEADAAEALPKAVAAARRLSRVNSTTVLEPHVDDCDAGNISELLGGAVLVLDGTDNFETRFLLNDYCVSAGKPWIYGAAVGSYGVVMPLAAADGPCLRCIYPEPPGGAQPTCETEGILNSASALVAAVQVSHALQFVAGAAGTLRFKITTADVWNGPLREVNLPPRAPDCPCCGKREFPFLHSRQRVPVSMCGRNAVQIHDRSRPLDLPALGARLQTAGTVRFNEFALQFAFEDFLMTVFPDGRAIIKGTTDRGVARSFYSRFIGN